MAPAADYPLFPALQEIGKTSEQLGLDFQEQVLDRLWQEIQYQAEAQQIHWSLRFLKEHGLSETVRERGWFFQHAFEKNSYAASLFCDFDMVPESNVTLCDQARGKLGASYDNPQQAYMWNRIGFTGGHWTWNRWWTPQQSYEQALDRDPNMAAAWNGLGETLKGWKSSFLMGRTVLEPQAYVHSLNINPNFTEAWTNLGDVGGGTVQAVEYDREHCYLKALMIKPEYALAWRGLAELGGFTYKDISYSASQCIDHALKLDPSDPKIWVTLGKMGGGTVDFNEYSKQQCLQKALELQGDGGVQSHAWMLLGSVGGGTVNGTTYGAQECFVKSLEICPDEAATWQKLGDEGGGNVKNQQYSAVQCYTRAIEMLENMFNKHFVNPDKFSNFRVNGSAWMGLGDLGGGSVRGIWHDAKTCYKAALWNQANFSHAWGKLGDIGGGHVFFNDLSTKSLYPGMKSGDSYTSKRCREIAVTFDVTNADAWTGLGWEDGGDVLGTHYEKAQCFINAAERDPDYPPAWYGLFTVGGGAVDMKAYSADEALKQALKLDPGYTDAWLAFCRQGGGQLGQTMYTKQACLSHLVDTVKDKKVLADTWSQLADLGGGTANGRSLNATECYLKALEMDLGNMNAWLNLCDTDGFTVQGRHYSQKNCNEQLVELKDTPKGALADAWLKLGNANGGMHFGKYLDGRTCYLKALELKPDSADAWYGLGKWGGGMPSFSFSRGAIDVTAGKWVNQIQSFCYSLELNSENADAWLRLGSATDIPGQERIVAGQNFTKGNCYEQALGYDLQLKAAWSGLAKEGGGTVMGTDYSAEACADKANPTAVSSSAQDASSTAANVTSSAQDVSSTAQGLSSTA
eukprot:TRINITY_DN16536_c0_g1_i1.p1 TRINITY_DN16536_c0_g1~~TRINITY_DN16536_c0_g1_i1.p1  ORF type:complete len:962 (+),score=187.88 TRINITY_DN16536_c0_g1_i1:316-2886(+)